MRRRVHIKMVSYRKNATTIWTNDVSMNVAEDHAQRAFFVEFVLIQDRFVNIEFTLILHQKMQIDSIKECVCWIQL